MQDTAGVMFGRVYIGWEGGNGYLPLRVNKCEVEAAKQTIYDLKVVDTVFPTFHFGGVMEAPKCKITPGTSTDPNLVLVLKHALDFSGKRDMGRFYILVKTMEETNKRDIRYVVLRGGVLVTPIPALKLEGGATEPQLDEMEFECETIEMEFIDNIEMPVIDEFDRKAFPES